MENFKKFNCEFIIENIVKESYNKSVYGGIVIRNIKLKNGYYKENIVILKIIKTCEREIEFILSLRHQAIPKLLYVWEEENYIYIVQEKILALSLFEYIKKNKNLTRNKRIMIAYNLSKFLLYIHRFSGLRIVHGDISPNNIIISDKDEFYIIDFGSSFCESIVKREKLLYGTEGYYSPKLIEDPMAVGRSIDIYSFAMILKLLEIDKLSIEGYELYKKCSKNEDYSKFDLESIMDNLLYMIN